MLPFNYIILLNFEGTIPLCYTAVPVAKRITQHKRNITAQTTKQVIQSLRLFSLTAHITAQKHAMGNTQNTGWYLNADATSRRTSESKALDIPQAGQGTPVSSRSRHSPPNTYLLTTPNATKSTVRVIQNHVGSDNIRSIIPFFFRFFNFFLRYFYG